MSPRTYFAAMLTGWLLGGAPSTAFAQDGAAPDELTRIERELEDKKRAQKELEEQAEKSGREAEQLQLRLVEAAQRLQDQEARANQLESRLSDLLSQEREVTEDLEEDQASLSTVLAALQDMELSRPPALAVAPDDAAEAARIAILLSAAAPELQSQADQLRADLERLQSLRADVAAETVALRAAEEELRSRALVLEDLILEKRAQERQAATAAAEAENEIAKLAAEATSLRDLVRRLEQRARSVTPRVKPEAPQRRLFPRIRPGAPDRTPDSDVPVARAPFLGEQQFANARGMLRPPVAGRLVQRFGERTDAGRSEGLALASRARGIVTAPFDGRVVFARAKKPIGNVLILDVGGGYLMILVGVDQFLCVESQLVLAGEPIGIMGRSGSDGAQPELYVEIRKDSEPVDPALWLLADNEGRARG